jgi:hypothetical protein
VLGDLLLNDSSNSPQPHFASTKEVERESVMLEKHDSKLASVSSKPESGTNMNEEQWKEVVKADCIRPGVPLNLQDARRLVTGFVEHYNTVRLHSAIGYITPADKLAGKEEAIFAARDQKLLPARETRKAKRNQNTHSLAGTPAFFQLTLNQYNPTIQRPVKTARKEKNFMAFFRVGHLSRTHHKSAKSNEGQKSPR